MNCGKSTKFRRALCLKIERRGCRMAYKCAACRKSKSDCVTSTDSKGCLRCVGKALTCDWRPFSEQDFEKIERERSRLRTAKLEARERRLAEEAKIARLERLEDFLEKREGELIRRGLESVDELEQLEKQEELAEQKRLELERAAVAAGPSGASSSVVGDPDNIWSPGSWMGVLPALDQQSWDLIAGDPMGDDVAKTGCTSRCGTPGSRLTSPRSPPSPGTLVPGDLSLHSRSRGASHCVVLSLDWKASSFAWHRSPLAWRHRSRDNLISL